jgi:Uma2 family endonuclease
MVSLPSKTEKHLITLEGFLTLPEVKPAFEYHNGRVKQKMPPLGEHSVLQHTLLKILDKQIEPDAIATAFPKLRSTFAGASYVPDVSVYRQDRIPRTSTGRIARRFKLPPDIAIEVRSPGQTVREFTKRCEWYVENGVRVALVVDDHDEVIYVFRPGHPTAIARGADPIELNDLGAVITIVPSQLFGALTIG